VDLSHLYVLWGVRNSIRVDLSEYDHVWVRGVKVGHMAQVGFEEEDSASVIWLWIREKED